VKATSFLKMALAVDGCLLAIAVAIALLSASTDSLLGVLVGGALGTANLFTLGWLCMKAIGTKGAKWPYMVGMAMKFLLLITLVYLAVEYVPMSIVWFVVGLSVSGLAILGATAYLSARSLDLTLE